MIWLGIRIILLQRNMPIITQKTILENVRTKIGKNIVSLCCICGKKLRYNRKRYNKCYRCSTKLYYIKKYCKWTIGLSDKEIYEEAKKRRIKW